MKEYLHIEKTHAREILDSRGNPTIGVEVYTKAGVQGVAKVPSGASTGAFEAHEMRDGKKRYQGKGVENAVEKVNTRIAELLEEQNILEQRGLDGLLLSADGTDNKTKLGANSVLGVSMAIADGGAKALGLPLYRYLGGVNTRLLPVPMMNIVNGGVHAKNSLDFQEFMIMPVGAPSFKEALRMGTEIYHKLKELLAADGLSTAVGDEGGFAPDLSGAEAVFEYLSNAVVQAGYTLGKEVVFAMDAAASELYNKETQMYYFPGENMNRTAQEMIDYYDSLCSRFPLCSIEDGLDEEDWDGWKKLTERLGQKVQLVGDDLFVTNTRRLSRGIQEKAGNAILVKVNQIGSVSEAMEAIEMAQKAGFHAVVSHRSGETEDTFIADLSVAVNAGQIKTGAPCRSDRVAKYNRLLQIEEELGSRAVYENPFSHEN